MDDVELLIAEVVEMNPALKDAFPDDPDRMGRIEGYVGRKRYAAMVPPSMIGDDLACKAYLRHIAAYSR